MGNAIDHLSVDLTNRSVYCALDDRAVWSAFSRLLDAAAGLRSIYQAAGEPAGFPGIHAAMVGDESAERSDIVMSEEHTRALDAVVASIFGTLRAAESWSREWE